MKNTIEVKEYENIYNQEVIDLILYIQNEESGVNLDLKDQMDLTIIHETYQNSGGGFWIALSNTELVGTIGLMKSNSNEGILKKFF